jgi:hypothetical protein
MAPVHFQRDYALAMAICVELYSARRNDPNEIWVKTFKERAPAFDTIYGGEDLECFAEVEERRKGSDSEVGEFRRVREATGWSR